MQMVTVVCYTATDYNDALNHWLNLGFKPMPSPLKPVDDVTFYERKNGQVVQLSETFDGGPAFVLHFSKD